MALLTDDCDITESYLRTYVLNNGDYYIEITEKDHQGFIKKHTVRISTSGGIAPTEVLLAISKLHDVMEKAGLNKEINFNQ